RRGQVRAAQARLDLLHVVDAAAAQRPAVIRGPKSLLRVADPPSGHRLDQVVRLSPHEQLPFAVGEEPWPDPAHAAVYLFHAAAGLEEVAELVEERDLARALL